MRDFELPGRSMVMSRNAMAATSHPIATLTAIEILRAGGKAMDAAVAASAVQCVVEAGSTGVGGDSFALLSAGGSADVKAFNGSGRAPAAATLDWFEKAGITAIERHSPHAVTVPGAVDAWAQMVRDHGRMELGELFQPAIQLARNGYVLTPRVAHDLASQQDLLRLDPTARATFLVDGDVPPEGSVQRQPKLADTLETIGREGPDAFYRGSLTDGIVSYLRDKGGLHTLEDFDTSRGEYVAPISTEFRGRRVFECPPNGQGVIALMIMKILERFRPCEDPLNSANLHIEVEATRLAYAERDSIIADAGFLPVSVETLLSDTLADELASRIDPDKASPPAVPLEVGAEHKDTVMICVVDKDRNAVSLINSIFHAYGSGLVTPQSGILLQNRGEAFVLKKGHPNAIGPRKRPLHTIIPGMVTEGDRVVMAFGVMGGNYQAMGHAHFLAKLFDHGLDLQTAIDLPRLFPLPGSSTVEVEGPLRKTIATDFAKRGFTVQPPKIPIGGAQAIWIDWERGVLSGGSDPRKDGCALGY
jgi:gamma-glutamyltranspeptidase/glutathione hydrolase